ncbi:DNA invertase Pin-like site-specific DNA recombinase [Nonomuraea muscovyensis]|uniref:DNA invertase Pin-like site-specific DNA recombinase n=1 Tax=Nonomuraea muscovyensis TaxID=1124761 RepID=A0A7X0F2Q3_9ACTN|nr:recombinase family protein [Nonomuraea muscovyensis]MBB6350930.1 DNA invertase Pin-like site-specific DNA recombinase [Nonomuraea muscovyensis]
MFFNMLTVFEADMLKMRTREGMAIARSRGMLMGRQPKLHRPPASRTGADAPHRRVHHR